MDSKLLSNFRNLPHSIKYSKLNWRYQISILMSVILLIMILQNIISTIYFFLPQHNKVDTTFTNPGNVQSKTSYAKISQWHLFGVAAPSGLAVTQLSIKLTGIVIDYRNNQTTAIIATPEGKEKIYHVGDSLPGGAIIYAISPREVIIQYMGRMERLPLKAAAVNNVQQNNSLDNAAIATPTEPVPAEHDPVGDNQNNNPQINKYMDMLKRFKNLAD
jgi:type II secretion system protein C